MLLCHKNSCGLHIKRPVGIIPNGRKVTELENLVVAILQEARSKHLIDCINDGYLNDDHHIEVTLTVKEIREAADKLNIREF